jgi:WD40 repeat protein
MAFAPDGTRLATNSFNFDMLQWDAQSGEQLASWRYPEDDSDQFMGLTSNALSYSPDGSLLVSGAVQDNGQLLVRDTATGDLIQVFNLPSSEIATRSAFIDDRRVAVLLANNLLPPAGNPMGTVPLLSVEPTYNVRIYNIATEELSEPLVSSKTEISGIAVSPDGTLLATVNNEDNTLCVWDIAIGERLYELTLPILSGIVTFSPDGQLLAAAGYNQTEQRHITYVLAAADGTRLIELAHRGILESIDFSSDGALFAAGMGNGFTELWGIAP